MHSIVYYFKHKSSSFVNRHLGIKEKRVLTGLEALKITGFAERELKGYVTMVGDRKHIEVDPFFMDLAGNAWTGPCITALLISILCRCTDRHRELYGSKSCDAVSDGDEALALDAIMRM